MPEKAVLVVSHMKSMAKSLKQCFRFESVQTAFDREPMALAISWDGKVGL